MNYQWISKDKAVLKTVPDVIFTVLYYDADKQQILCMDKNNVPHKLPAAWFEPVDAANARIKLN